MTVERFLVRWRVYVTRLQTSCLGKMKAFRPFVPPTPAALSDAKCFALVAVVPQDNHDAPGQLSALVWRRQLPALSTLPDLLAPTNCALSADV
jgi:hypothetical protein